MQGMPDYFKIDKLTVRLGTEVTCLRLHQVPITKLTLVGLLPLLDPPADDDLLERVREWPTTRACRFELPASLEELRLEGCGAGVFGQRFFSAMARLEGAGNEHGMPCHVFLGWCGARPVWFFFPLASRCPMTCHCRLEEAPHRPRPGPTRQPRTAAPPQLLHG